MPAPFFMGNKGSIIIAYMVYLSERGQRKDSNSESLTEPLGDHRTSVRIETLPVSCHLVNK